MLQRREISMALVTVQKIFAPPDLKELHVPHTICSKKGIINQRSTRFKPVRTKASQISHGSVVSGPRRRYSIYYHGDYLDRFEDIGVSGPKSYRNRSESYPMGPVWWKNDPS